MLEEFEKYPLHQLGFMHTNFTPQQVVNAHNIVWGNHYKATVSNIAETQVEKTNLNQLWNEILEIKKRKSPFPVSFTPEIKTKKELEKFYLHPNELIGKRCNDSFSNIMIKSDGTVIPSHGRCYNITVGNLHDNNLKEIWNSSLMSKFRKDLMTAGGLFPACSRCCSAF